MEKEYFDSTNSPSPRVIVWFVPLILLGLISGVEHWYSLELLAGSVLLIACGCSLLYFEYIHLKKGVVLWYSPGGFGTVYPANIKKTPILFWFRTLVFIPFLCVMTLVGILGLYSILDSFY